MRTVVHGVGPQGASFGPPTGAFDQTQVGTGEEAQALPVFSIPVVLGNLAAGATFSLSIPMPRKCRVLSLTLSATAANSTTPGLSVVGTTELILASGTVMTAAAKAFAVDQTVVIPALDNLLLEVECLPGGVLTAGVGLIMVQVLE